MQDVQDPSTQSSQQHYQSAAQPFWSRNSSHACLSARLGRSSVGFKGSRVRGSVGWRRRCSWMEALSYDLPVLVCSSVAVEAAELDVFVYKKEEEMNKGR